MSRVLDEMDVFYTEIRDTKQKIADLNAEKINLRAKSWADADGIADAKKDFVRSMVSDIQRDIDKLEADVEYFYGQIKILGHRLEYGDE